MRYWIVDQNITFRVLGRLVFRSFIAAGSVEFSCSGGTGGVPPWETEPRLGHCLRRGRSLRGSWQPPESRCPASSPLSSCFAAAISWRFNSTRLICRALNDSVSNPEREVSTSVLPAPSTRRCAYKFRYRVLHLRDDSSRCTVRGPAARQAALGGRIQPAGVPNGSGISNVAPPGCCRSVSNGPIPLNVFFAAPTS